MKFQIFLDKDLNSTNSGCNTTSPMTSSLITLYTTRGVDDVCQASIFSFSGFRENDVQMFYFNPICVPHHVTDEVINLILHTSGHRWDLWSFRFLDKDFNSTNYGENTTPLMTSSLSPYILHGELMTYAKFNLFSLRSFWRQWCSNFFH